MEEKHATDSIASVTIKPDYAPSEYCSSEAPPAYHKPKSATVQVAKIIATTFVVCSFILGVFILASAYITASASCRELEQDLELLNKVSESFGPDCNNNNNNNVPQPEALLLRDDDSKSTLKRQVESVPKKSTKEAENNDEEDSDEHKIEFPLHIDFDEIAGNLVAKNQRSKMNCIVEKKKAEEVVDHQPKTVRLPFGVNLTTDPRFERLTGERMVIICESGNIQSSAQPQPERTHNGLDDNNDQNQNDEDDDDEQDTIMIQPVMIPIPQTAFQTHMPQQQMPHPNNPSNMQEMNVIRRPFHPMEVMRPPPSPMMMINQFRPPMEPSMMRSPSMRPSSMMMEARPNGPTIERIISFRQNIQPQVPQALDHQQNSEEIEQERPKMMFIPQQVQIRVEAAEQSEPQQQQQQQEATPNPIIQHIIQQIIAQKIMESQKAMIEENNRQQQTPLMEEPQRAQIIPVPQRPILRPIHQNSPIPEEILTQLNRLPSNKEGVIFAVPANEDDSTNSSEEDDASSSSSDDDTNNNNNNNSEQSQENSSQTADGSNNNNKQEQQPSEQSIPNPEMMINNRQAFIRRLPVDIPVNMMQLQSSVPSSPQEQEVEISEATRPHYVQPRSV